MKIWINDSKQKTHRLVKFNCEAHSDFEYFGNVDDDRLSSFLLELKDDIDVEKNMKLLKYFGYLHLFIINKDSGVE